MKMAFPFNHKTVFVLDHSPSFHVPCEKIEFDLQKSRSAATEPLFKSLWTCSVESVLEYCRIVWDIFPKEKFIRFVVSDTTATDLNSWDVQEQNLSIISANLADAGSALEVEGKKRKSGSRNGGVMHGLSRALQVLGEITEPQKEAKGKLLNRGRIICFTHAKDDRRIEQLISGVQSQLAQLAEDREEGSVPIDQIQLDIIHCYTADEESTVTPCSSKSEENAQFSYNVVSVDASRHLSKKMLSLALRHYDLASTTVTGIPMKEEQNASTSANYDVELFHKANQTCGDLNSTTTQTAKEGCEYKTITLKWCTPRGSSTADLHHCIATSRITPTDVNSRPSSCLTNFLLSGRSVMLEMPSRSGTKTLSHMLTSHGGEIFIHTLFFTNRSVLEDPPSISEGLGGRVTDYRVPDLATIMRSNRLAPWFSKDAITKARDRVARFSKFCPMTIGSTTIFNMAALDPMIRIMCQLELSEEDVAECRKIIYTLLQMENRSEVLPFPVQPVAAGKSKTPKKEEQYRLMYAELEQFLSCHLHSEKHAKVLECLLEVRNKPLPERPRFTSLDGRSDEKNELNITDGRASKERSTSPGSAAANPRRTKSVFDGGKSLLDIWTGRIRKANAKRHVPFHGMRNFGDTAKLYLNLERMKDASGGAEPMNVDG